MKNFEREAEWVSASEDSGSRARKFKQMARQTVLDAKDTGGRDRTKSELDEDYKYPLAELN